MALPERCVVCGRPTGGCCTVMVVDAAWLAAWNEGTVLCACGRVLKRGAVCPERRVVVSYDRCPHCEEAR
jgi:hypothetical protein